MGRRSYTRALNVWMNGQLVGCWSTLPAGTSEFRYDPTWAESPASRPLSLSLPLNFDNRPLRGERVGFYFDNLLPDSESIRKRLQSRFGTQSQDAFDLLEAIGQDCVGAVQLLGMDKAPENIFTIQAQPLTGAQVEQWLVDAVAPAGALGQHHDDQEFRISIAGAQEKTALIRHEGQWCRPLGATPTTHIFKLPLGLVGARRADMSSSVENEWLCAQILHEFGLPVASCEITRFGAQKVLVVERFDRRLAASRDYWLRLPQEDFCQATGAPSSAKYECDNGPGLETLASVLRTSESSEEDLGVILRAQLIFWLLAATDGHAKNFSIFLAPGGGYRLTPLYDVLSAWPIEGSGANQVPFSKLKLAMSVRGKNKHYHLKEIQPRHFFETAKRCGYPNMPAAAQSVIVNVPRVISAVRARLPEDFPVPLFETIASGMRACAERFDRLLKTSA